MRARTAPGAGCLAGAGVLSQAAARAVVPSARPAQSNPAARLPSARARALPHPSPPFAARLLPAVQERAPRLPQGHLAHRQLGQRRAAAGRRNEVKRGARRAAAGCWPGSPLHDCAGELSACACVPALGVVGWGARLRPAETGRPHGGRRPAPVTAVQQIQLGESPWGVRLPSLWGSQFGRWERALQGRAASGGARAGRDGHLWRLPHESGLSTRPVCVRARLLVPHAWSGSRQQFHLGAPACARPPWVSLAPRSG